MRAHLRIGQDGAAFINPGEDTWVDDVADLDRRHPPQPFTDEDRADFKRRYHALCAAMGEAFE